MRKEESDMNYIFKGYPVSSGYMGWIEEEKRYRLFATENDYEEYVKED